MLQYRTFVLSLEDSPGALNRVVSMFRRRAYNIVSLSVGRTHEPGISRMTCVVEADAERSPLIQAQALKLVCVLSIEDISELPFVQRELALIKLHLPDERRLEVMNICNVFRARVVDVGPQAMIIEISGAAEKIQGLVNVLAPIGILEMVQCGTIAMTRGLTQPDSKVQAA